VESDGKVRQCEQQSRHVSNGQCRSIQHLPKEQSADLPRYLHAFGVYAVCLTPLRKLLDSAYRVPVARPWIAVNEVSPEMSRQAAVLLSFDDTLKLAYQGQEFLSVEVDVELYRCHEVTPLEQIFDFGFSGDPSNPAAPIKVLWRPSLELL
jgi:hypothetical protein